MKTRYFYGETQIRKKTRGGEGEKFTIKRRFTRITCMYWYFFWVMIGRKAQKSSSRWRRKSICTELSTVEICVTVWSACQICSNCRDCWRDGWNCILWILSLSIIICLEHIGIIPLQRGRGEVAWLQTEISMVVTGDFWVKWKMLDCKWL